MAEDREFAKKFKITRTIYLNSERSEQFFVTKCFFNLFLEVSHILQIRTIIIQIRKEYWDLEHAGEVRIFSGIHTFGVLNV